VRGRRVQFDDETWEAIEAAVYRGETRHQLPPKIRWVRPTAGSPLALLKRSSSAAHGIVKSVSPQRLS
jgi:hypothetical protein